MAQLNTQHKKNSDFWIWGYHACRKVIAVCPHLILGSYFDPKKEESLSLQKKIVKLKSENKSLNKNLEILSRLPKAVDTQRHQGVALRLKHFDYVELSAIKNKVEILLPREKPHLWLLCDGIEDPYNFGAILRSAVAFGVEAVFVWHKGQAPVSGVVAQGSAGYCFDIPICQIKRFQDLEDLFQGFDAEFVALDAEGEFLSSFKTTEKQPLHCIAIVGAEGRGLNPFIRRRVAKKLSIPMLNSVESLNASVAASLMLYELSR